MIKSTLFILALTRVEDGPIHGCTKGRDAAHAVGRHFPTGMHLDHSGH